MMREAAGRVLVAGIAVVVVIVVVVGVGVVAAASSSANFYVEPVSRRDFTSDGPTTSTMDDTEQN